MRTRPIEIDNQIEYFIIQHKNNFDEWIPTNLANALFNNLSFADKVSGAQKSNRYRELLEPQSASSDLWQEHNINGYTDVKDAHKTLTVLRVEYPFIKFRIVRINLIISTTEIMT